MNELQAREAIVKWATRYFMPEEGDEQPTATVLGIGYDESETLWVAELTVSTLAPHAHICFWFDNILGIQGNGPYITAIHYQ